MQLEYLETQKKRKIAYCKTEGKGPTVVFLGGFKSEMAGSKATFLESWAERAGHAYLRLDYSGHGKSSGDFTDGCIGDWLEDAQSVIEHATDGPLILIGSSMGGWISLLLAKKLEQRIVGLLTIAAAPDFTEEEFWLKFSEVQRQEILVEGVTYLPSEYDEPYPITKKLIEDGRRHLLSHGPLEMSVPVRMLQGDLDTSVTRETALSLFDRMNGHDILLIFIKGGDHSLSAPQNLFDIECHLKNLISIVT